MNIRDVLADRAQSHGHFPNVSYVSQRMKELFRSQENWHNLSDAQREMMDMVASKFGRILSGNVNEIDHYKDVSGYAELCVVELEQQLPISAPAPWATPRTAEDIAPALRRDYSKSKVLAERLAELTPAQAAE